jgi:hypothetical protein
MWKWKDSRVIEMSTHALGDMNSSLVKWPNELAAHGLIGSPMGASMP